MRKASAEHKERGFALFCERWMSARVFGNITATSWVLQFPTRSQTTFGGAPRRTLKRWKSSSFVTSRHSRSCASCQMATSEKPPAPIPYVQRARKNPGSSRRRFRTAARREQAHSFRPPESPGSGVRVQLRRLDMRECGHESAAEFVHQLLLRHATCEVSGTSPTVIRVPRTHGLPNRTSGSTVMCSRKVDDLNSRQSGHPANRMATARHPAQPQSTSRITRQQFTAISVAKLWITGCTPPCITACKYASSRLGTHRSKRMSIPAGRIKQHLDPELDLARRVGRPADWRRTAAPGPSPSRRRRFAGPDCEVRAVEHVEHLEAELDLAATAQEPQPRVLDHRRSTFAKPGPVRMLRPALPSVPCGCSSNADGSK